MTVGDRGGREGRGREGSWCFLLFPPHPPQDAFKQNIHSFLFHFGLHPNSLLFVIVNFAIVVILNFCLERGGFSEMLFFPRLQT